jgi:glutathione S-transferase
MQLHMTPTSPYARKVRVVARERGVALDEIVTPPLESEAIRAANPLGKIPALVMADGTLVFDSPVIVEWLDALAPGTPLLPRDPLLRAAHLQWQALADGLLDSAVAYRFEIGFHSAEQQSEVLKARHLKAVTAGLDHAEAHLERLPARFGVPHIALGSALGYLDFRFADLAWRTGRPKLAALAEQCFARPSFVDTPHTAA